METQNVRQSTSIVPSRLSTSVLLPSENAGPLASPRLSALDHYRRLYGSNGLADPYYYPSQTLAPVNQAVVDDIIDKYVRRPDGSPVKSQEEKRAYGSLSPSAAALSKAEDTVNALKQSGVNPVAATDKALTDSGLLNHYGLAPLSPLYHPYHGYGHHYLHHGHHGHHYGHHYGHHHGHHHAEKDAKEHPLLADRYGLDHYGYRYGGYNAYPYYGYPLVHDVKPVEKKEEKKPEEKKPEQKEEAPKSVIAPQLNDADFYKKYGFYPTYDRYTTPTTYTGYPYAGLYGAYPHGNYGYPYGSHYGYNYPSYGRTSYVNADGKVVDYTPLTTPSTGYTRQYTAPVQTEQSQPKSNSGSRKPSQQVDDDRFDFDAKEAK